MNFDSTKVIFFDLDNTLFDHTRAERNALFSLIKENAEVFAGVEPEMFVRVYREVNKVLWKKMAAGEVSGEELKGLRFQMSLSEFDRDDGDAELLSKQYFEFYSRQSCALPNAHETLAYLRPNYELGILSNGFPEIQERKLRNLQMAAHFKFKIYSGEVGAMKPAREIFEAAMVRSGAAADEIVFVGDSYEDDIEGAKALGWRVIHLTPDSKKINSLADLEINNLSDLRQIF